MTDIHDLIDRIRQHATSKQDLGAAFERLIQFYLRTDPQYAERFSDVWRWMEWPARWASDVGIDLVAREAVTGNYWAIQCKFFDDQYAIQKSDIDSFFTASGKTFRTDEGTYSFVQRLIVSSTDKWSRHAENALADQTIPVIRLGLKDLEESPIDWSRFDVAKVTAPLRPKKQLRDHQEEAIAAALEGFETSDRGKLIMACGTGKTFTALKLMERMVDRGERVLFLAPSISLVAQTLREWTREADTPFHAFVVCSDTKVGKNEEDIRTHDLAYPATTDAGKLAKAIQQVEAARPDRRVVIFCTYQSTSVIEEAHRRGLGEFDLIICDEAHRTTGLTLKGENPSDFQKVHNNGAIRGKKRLYMTATPRIYGEASKTRANEASAILYSMDDEETYGPEFYRLGFGKAVELDLLSEYKVLIVAVDKDRMARLANAYNEAFQLDEKKAIDIRFATKIIGSWKGLSKQGLKLVDEEGIEDAEAEKREPMRRAVAFNRSIKDSKTTSEVFARLVELYRQEHGDDEETGSTLVSPELKHVDGTMNALVRQAMLDWLKEEIPEGECRVLSNARCLSEGIDVPALDAVIFFDTRESIVDIVQSVGRVMRKAPGKRYGYIVLPVVIPLDKATEYNSYIESDPQFQGIWKVIKALRAHDESLVDEAEFRRKIKVISDHTKEAAREDETASLPLDFPKLPIDAISEAVYAIIPKKLGDREYWSDWAKSVAQIAQRLIARIEALIEDNPNAQSAFDSFLAGLHKNINPAISKAETIEMLAQHVITRPVFEAVFEGYSFTDSNPVSQSLEKVIDIIDDHQVASEAESLEKFYENVRERVRLAKSDKSKQEVIRNLYDTFFRNAFPKLAERLGIVYTPVEVVDFIVHSAQHALKEHFGRTLSDEGIQILDPFTGTGTFIVRLLQSDLIEREVLARKYRHEIHANEIVLLAYYIAGINIESAYHDKTGQYEPFRGIVLTDTFQMFEAEQGDIEEGFSKENTERVQRQKQQRIQVIFGNPPYSVNENPVKYERLDGRIEATYAKRSTATNKNSLYDSYIRAFRWASDRIEEEGIVCFVSNGGWLDGNTMDGFRACLEEEFSDIYVFNLRGNQRTSGELSRKEGGKIFGSGSRTPVTITILVKRKNHQGKARIRYHDIGDYLSRETKLEIIQNFRSIANVPWKDIHPNAHHDWINQRSDDFQRLVPLNDGKGAVFDGRSNGLKTQRDAWCYNFSRDKLYGNIERHIAFYNAELDRLKPVLASLASQKKREEEAKKLVRHDSKEIKWTAGLIHNLARSRRGEASRERIVTGLYRPFTRQHLYCDRLLNERVYRVPAIFPTPHPPNLAIQVTGAGASKEFSCLITNTLPDLEVISKGQCFPLYWYESRDKVKNSGDLLTGSALTEVGDYVRRDAITDEALENFRKHYGDATIIKEDIFYYVYGVLYSPEYRERYAADLKKELPRIPLAPDFWAFVKAGRALADLHLNYETVERWPLEEVITSTIPDYRVEKMRFPSKTDKSAIIYNHYITLKGIPDEAYEYVVNGKSAVEWIMDRYQVRTDKETGIVNDPNDWCDEIGDERYIIDLIKRVVRVSVETVRIVKELPTPFDSAQGAGAE